MIQTNYTNAWSDFPRDRNGQVYYGGMNTLGTELLQQGRVRHSGIIAADFPGPGLIDSIIKLNGVHSNEKEILISQIPSESSPLSGQQNRSSQNFKIDNLPVGTKELKWVIEPSEKDHPSTISFHVMIDVSLGTDSIRWKNISHESRTEAYSNTKYYIASPIGATSKFTVKIYAITN